MSMSMCYMSHESVCVSPCGVSVHVGCVSDVSVFMWWHVCTVAGQVESYTEVCPTLSFTSLHSPQRTYLLTYFTSAQLLGVAPRVFLLRDGRRARAAERKNCCDGDDDRGRTVG